MSDDESEDAEEEGPAVELGDGEPVEGAPIARVASRLTWGIGKSTIVDREGDTVVRTADGPKELRDLLTHVETPYFEHRREFEAALRDVTADGPVPTASE